MNTNVADDVAEKLRKIYEITAELETMFPGRHFTPDGHLIGSIGEVLVAHKYDLELMKASYQTHDAITCDGKNVQIKATQRDSIDIKGEPEYLIVIKINRDGSYTEIYNGLGKRALKVAGKLHKNGERTISLSKLRSIAKDAEPDEMIKKMR